MFFRPQQLPDTGPGAGSLSRAARSCPQPGLPAAQQQNLANSTISSLKKINPKPALSLFMGDGCKSGYANSSAPGMPCAAQAMGRLLKDTEGLCSPPSTSPIQRPPTAVGPLHGHRWAHSCSSPTPLSNNCSPALHGKTPPTGKRKEL